MRTIVVKFVYDGRLKIDSSSSAVYDFLLYNESVGVHTSPEGLI